MSISPEVRFLDRTTPPHLLTLVIMASVSAMNMSIFLPSLPAMTKDLGTSYSVMQLSISLYLAVTALVQIFAGPLADKYGRRPVMLWAIVIFLAATFGCMMATTIEVFLFFRMVQAAVAVAMVLSRAIIRDIVPASESAAMIGYVTMGMSLVPMFAPAVGGFLQDAVGWRATFLFLIGFGAFLGVLCWFDQGETNRSGGMSFRAQFAEYPELFTSRRFWGYALAAAFASGSFFAFLGGAPYVATNVFGLNPTETGFLFGIPPFGYFFGNYLSGRYSVKIGINRMILIGAFILVAGMSASLLISYAGYGSAVMFFSFCTTVGLGNGMVLPNATAGLLAVRPALAGTASGVGGAVMIGGGAGLSQLAGVVLTAGEGSYPLQWIMWASAVASLFCIFYVMRREQQLAIT